MLVLHDLPAPPVFVVGAPRSGTSLLYRCLCLHPDTAWISNYQRRMPKLSQLGRAVSIARRFPKRRMDAWFSSTGDQAYRYSEERNIGEWIFPAPVEGEPFFAACGIAGDDAPASKPRHRQIADLRRRVSSLLKRSSSKVFVSKRIGHNRRIPLLLEAFPDARFIHVIRDGRAVALSLPKADWWPECTIPWYGGTPTQWQDQGRNPTELAARHWAEELSDIARGLSYVPQANKCELRYEALQDDAAEHLATIAQRLGLRKSHSFEAALSQVQFRDSLWRETNDQQTIAQIEAIQADTLRNYGYL